MLHKRKSFKKSRALNKRDKDLQRPCPFCDLAQVAEIIEQTETMLVIRQRVPYDQFEGVVVSDHLMLIPRKHHVSLETLTDQEKIEYVTLAAKYESGDYGIYSRAKNSMTRSVEHVHTHLLELKGPRVRRMVFIEKPYILLMSKPKRIKVAVR